MINNRLQTKVFSCTEQCAQVTAAEKSCPPLQTNRNFLLKLLREPKLKSCTRKTQDSLRITKCSYRKSLQRPLTPQLSTTSMSFSSLRRTSVIFFQINTDEASKLFEMIMLKRRRVCSNINDELQSGFSNFKQDYRGSTPSLHNARSQSCARSENQTFSPSWCTSSDLFEGGTSPRRQQ